MKNIINSMKKYKYYILLVLLLLIIGLIYQLNKPKIGGAVFDNTSGAPKTTEVTATTTYVRYPEIISLRDINNKSYDNGVCIPFPDADGAGITYLYVNDGKGYFTTTCK